RALVDELLVPLARERIAAIRVDRDVDDAAEVEIDPEGIGDPRLAGDADRGGAGDRRAGQQGAGRGVDDLVVRAVLPEGVVGDRGVRTGVVRQGVVDVRDRHGVDA